MWQCIDYVLHVHSSNNGDVLYQRVNRSHPQFQLSNIIHVSRKFPDINQTMQKKKKRKNHCTTISPDPKESQFCVRHRVQRAGRALCSRTSAQHRLGHLAQGYPTGIPQVPREKFEQKVGSDGIWWDVVPGLVN